MKTFLGFRLDSANQSLWRGQQRVAIPPKPYDILRYLVENPGRLVTQDELLDKLWAEIYVNPELIRKYILDIRKILGDRPDKPEFIETVPKRGYRFIAPVVDEAEPPDSSTSPPTRENGAEERVQHEAARSESGRFSSKRSMRKFVLIPVLLVLVAGGIGAKFQLARNERSVSSSSDTSIAVLPFADMSPTKDQEYFSDGLSEQLISSLARVPGVKIVGRASAFQFKGRNEDLREVGRKLGVANILEGSVRREGNHVRITAELIKAGDGFQLWSQTYDREIDDIFAVQDEIARAATEALQPKLLGGNGHPVASTSRSASPEAYQAYLEANYFFERGTGKEDLGKALVYADQAIKLDPKYAPAWALRAALQNNMAQAGMTDVTEGYRKARNDAERSIALDPTSTSAYLALAHEQIDSDWDWGGAEISVTKAAGLEPGSAEVFNIRSYLFRILGNLDEAIKLKEQAVALDPLRTNSHSTLGYLLYSAGRYDEAQAELQKALDLNSQAAYVHFHLGKVLIAKGKLREALAEIEKEPLEGGKLTGQVMTYHALGRERDSNAALAELIAKHETDWAYQIAEVYGYRDQLDKSFEWLQRAYKQRDPGLPSIKVDPLLKNLRHDPRYTEFLKKMRLPT